MAGCQAGRELSPTCLLRSLAQSLETHTEEGTAIKLQGDSKGRVLAGKSVTGKLSPAVRANLFLSSVVKESPAIHILWLLTVLEGTWRGSSGLPQWGGKGKCGERGTNLGASQSQSDPPNTLQPHDFTCLGLGVPL